MAKPKWQQTVERREAIVDERFRAACQERVTWEDYGSRLRALVPKALDVIAEALDDPAQAPKIALAVLKLAGLNDVHAPLPPSRMTFGLNADRFLAVANDDEVAG